MWYINTFFPTTVWYFHAQRGKHRNAGVVFSLQILLLEDLGIKQKDQEFLRVASDSRHKACLLTFYFYSHVMFYSCRCHFTARVHRWAAVLWTGNLPEKCFSVMQLFWFTSTRGHKQMHSLVSGTHHNEPCVGWRGTSSPHSTGRCLFGKKQMTGVFIISPYYKETDGLVMFQSETIPDLLLMLRLSHLSTDARILASSLLSSHISLTRKHSLISSTLTPEESILMRHLEKLALWMASCRTIHSSSWLALVNPFVFSEPTSA